VEPGYALINPPRRDCTVYYASAGSLLRAFVKESLSLTRERAGLLGYTCWGVECRELWRWSGRREVRFHTLPLESSSTLPLASTRESSPLSLEREGECST
jgi:hypothetical protein